MTKSWRIAISTTIWLLVAIQAGMVIFVSWYLHRPADLPKVASAAPTVTEVPDKCAIAMVELDRRQAPSTHYLVAGSNWCQKATAPQHVWSVKFYYQESRIGFDVAIIGALEPGEKFIHRFPIPKYVLEQGAPDTVSIVQ